MEDTLTVTIPAKLSDLAIVPPTWEWRRGQRELAQKILDSPKRIVMLEAECGSGKSIIPIAAARAADRQAIVLIQTLQLQEQYMRDFYNAKMMAGRRHSTCNINNRPADRAPCTIGIRCSMRGVWDPATKLPVTEPSCNYFRRKAENARANVSIQNYAYWLSETKNETSIFGQSDWIICDEAHELDAICMAAGMVEVRNADIHNYSAIDAPKTTRIEDWQEWARLAHTEASLSLAKLVTRIESMGVSLSMDPFSDPIDVQPDPEDDPDPSMTMDDLTAAILDLKRYMSALIELIDISEYSEWVFDATPTTKQFKPIYGKYGFARILAGATEKIVLMSAFLAPELLMRTLGLDPDDVEIIEAPRTFDRTESQVYYCPTIKLGYKTTREEWKYVVGVADSFAEEFFDTPGLVHVPSVTLRDTVLSLTKTRARWIAYDGTSIRNPQYGTKDEAITKFTKTGVKGRPGYLPRILIGQSITTGLDLPHIPRWQIILKLSYMPLEDPAVKRRKEVDKDFYNYYTICQIVQAVGRVKRAPDHHGKTIILDANFGWFYAANKTHFPKWFRENLQQQGWDHFLKPYRTNKMLKFQAGIYP